TWAMSPSRCVVFTTYRPCAGGADPRFKIDHFGDWRESYPAQDLRVANGSYQITFDATSKQITTQPVGSCSGAPDSWQFRGTPNDWGTTAMTASSATQFTTCQTFGGISDPRFKIDRFGDWRESYPAQDLRVANGSYQINFDSISKQITTQSVSTCSSSPPPPPPPPPP